MKTLYKLGLCFFIFLISTTNIYADSKSFDLREYFEVRFITGYCDQDPTIRIARITNIETGKDAFCIEPNVAYQPAIYKYNKELLTNSNIYEIVKKYQLNNDLSDEKYIATQLLIWEEVTGISYSFDNLNHLDYGSEEIMNYDLNYKNILENLDYDIDYNEVFTIENIIQENSTIISEDIEVVDTNGNNLSIIQTNENTKTGSIKIITNNDLEHCVVYHSNNSQDIYYFDSDYSDINTTNILFHTNPIYTNVYFNKLNIQNDQFIENALFTVYDLYNQEPDTEILFLHPNFALDLYNLFELTDSQEIELSERYNQYFDGRTMQTTEIGMFPYRIQEDKILIKEGICFVTNDSSLTNNSYQLKNVKSINSSYSFNSTSYINNIPINKELLLCETKPANGYIYSSEPCKIINTDIEHRNDIHTFYNDTRLFTLRLIKENSDHTIPLDGAKFKISYLENDEIKEIVFFTGALNIQNPDHLKYLYLKYQNEIEIIDINNNDYIQYNKKPGLYYYYLSNEDSIDTNRIIENKTYVVDGGYIIEDIPYSSFITVEELQAPDGYYINESTYHIKSDISYNEIVFKNYRVNEAVVIPAKKRKQVLTCVEN